MDNMNLLKDGSLTVGGALLFPPAPQFKLPVFIVKAGAVDSNE